MTSASTSAVSPLAALRILMRVQLKSSLATFGGGSRGVLRGLGQALTYLAYAAFGAVISLSVALMVFFIDPALIPGAAVLTAGIAAVILTFQNASGSLFGFRDYDQVMSLPVPTWVVVLSRVGALFAVQVVVSAVLCMPMFAVAALTGAFGVAQALVAVVTIVFAAAVPVSVVVFLSFALAVVASRFRYSNIVYVVTSLVLLAVAMVASFAFAGTASTDVEGIASFVYGAVYLYPFADWARAAWAGDLVCLVPFCLVSLAAMAACVAILSRCFMAINAALAGHDAGRAVDIDTAAGRQTGVLKAMVIKELKCLVNTPIYALNCISGEMFMVFLTVLMVAMGKQGSFNAASDYMGLDAGFGAAAAQLSEAILPWLFIFLATTATSASSSVSMEGSAHWIMETAPVPRRTVLLSKVLASAIHVLGLLVVCLVVLTARGVLSPVAALLTLALAGAGQLFVACLGVMIDAAAPRLDWIKPADAVKKGRATMVVALTSLVITFGGGAACIFLCMQMGELAAFAMTFATAAVLAVLAWLCFNRVVKTSRF